MKKLYINPKRYLFNSNAEGEVGAGGEPTTPVVAPVADPEPTPTPAKPAPSDWKASLSSDLQGHDAVKGAETVEDLVKALTATPKVEPPPVELKAPEGLSPKIVEFATSKGIGQDGLDEIVALKTGVDEESATARIEAQTNGQKELYSSWVGDDKDKAKEIVSANLALANRVIDFVDPDPADSKSIGLKKFLTSAESGLPGQEPVVIQMFYALGKAFTESGFLKSASPPTPIPIGKKAHQSYPNDAPKSA